MGPGDEHDGSERGLLRASDAERDQAIEVLATACGEGRLSLGDTPSEARRSWSRAPPVTWPT